MSIRLSWSCEDEWSVPLPNDAEWPDENLLPQSVWRNAVSLHSQMERMIPAKAQRRKEKEGKSCLAA